MLTTAEVLVQAKPGSVPSARLGFWVCVLTAVVTVVSFAIAIETPPRSGPFCAGSCVVYPYADTAAFFPRDYLWIFPALLLTPLYLLACACVEPFVHPGCMQLSRAALAFATISTALITLDYFVQIEVMQPSLLKAETAGLGLYSQYNPHGIFIALEDLGYLMMSASFLCLGPALHSGSRLQRAVRRLLTIGGVIGVVSFVVMSLVYGATLETRFELTIISINWTTLTAGMVMLSILFRRILREKAN